ncbi:YeaH/YhbH family protein [Candidatus Kaiserbacteria bacterium]|nr:YeaH/YhbH family protein [Candidatus Kaiserbacteria bacterium]
MSTIIDQRKSMGGRSVPNRDRFARREETIFRDAVREGIGKKDMTQAGDEQSRRVKVTAKSMQEPSFRHSGKGIFERVLPGNKQFNPGDRVPINKDGSGSGGGKQGSLEGDEGGIELEMSEEKYFDILFERCGLPNLIKRRLTGSEEVTQVRAGIVKEGPYPRMNIVRSFNQARVRRKAMMGTWQRKLEALEKERSELEAELAVQSCSLVDDPRQKRLREIERHITTFRGKIDHIRLDPMDLRFRGIIEVPKPVTNAVVFAIRDSSVSMGDKEMEISYLFILLLYRFLKHTKKYSRVVIRFIEHTTEAFEVSQEEFFKTRRTGGTNISSAYEKMLEIVRNEYPIADWNIYGAQCSDGDNALEDMDDAMMLLEDIILPIVQYFAYAEINSRPEAPSVLWRTMKPVADRHEHLAMRNIADTEEIYPVFRDLFEEKGVRR